MRTARGIPIRQESLASEKGLAQVLAGPLFELERTEREILAAGIRPLHENVKKLENLLRDRGHRQGDRCLGQEVRRRHLQDAEELHIRELSSVRSGEWLRSGRDR